MSSYLEYARQYHQAGINIIPIKRGTKIAAVNWRAYQDTFVSWAELREWFEGRHDYELAAIGGAISANLVIIDFDDMASFHAYAARFAPLMNTKIVISGSGKRHLWYRVARLPQSCKATAQRIELRGTGNYTLVPPSLHPAGARYRFGNRARIMPLPDLQEVLDWLGKTPRQGILGAQRGAGRRLLPCAQALLSGQAIPPEGARNNTLYALAHHYVLAGHSLAAAQADLGSLAASWGETAPRAERTVVSAYHTARYHSLFCHSTMKPYCAPESCYVAWKRHKNVPAADFAVKT